MVVPSTHAQPAIATLAAKINTSLSPAPPQIHKALPPQQQQEVTQAQEIAKSCSQPTKIRITTQGQGTTTSLSHWTSKQKYLHIEPHHLQPQLATSINGFSEIITRPTNTHSSQIRQLEDAALQMKAQDGIGISSEELKNSNHCSKSQSAAKRQRSALWFARANLLKMSLGSVNCKGSHTNSQSQYKSRGIISPKGLKVSQRAHQLFGLHQAQPQSRMPHTSGPGSFVFNKSKKHSLNLARRTIEKLLKKQTGEQISMLAKATVQAPNSQFGLQVGEVFSSLAKMNKKSVVQPFEVAAANMIRVSAMQQAHVKSAKPRKKVNTKHQIAQMALQAQLSSSPAPLIALHSHKSQLMKASSVCQSAKVSVQVARQGQRTSQSRLETFEMSYPIKRGSYQLPVHKFKKRLNQPLGNNSMQSLQASLLGVQAREIRPTTVQGKQLRATPVRSKSKSPVKKSNSRLAPKLKLMSSKRATIQRALPQSSLCDDIGLTSEDFHNVANFDELCAHPSIQSAQKSYTNFAAPRPFNLNPKSITAITARQKDSIKVQDKDQRRAIKEKKRKTKRSNYETSLNAVLAEETILQKHAESDLKQQPESSSEEQSVADEVLDPEAAMAVLRELGNLCLFQTAQRSSEEQDDCQSELSHRSHDHLGCAASPLILSYSEHGSRLDRRALSENEFESERCESECEVVESCSEENFPLGLAIGQQQQKKFAKPERDAPLDHKHSSLHSRARLTVPTLKAHTLAYLSASGAHALNNDLSSKTELVEKDKEGATLDCLKNTRGQMLPPGRKNIDVTEPVTDLDLEMARDNLTAFKEDDEDD